MTSTFASHPSQNRHPLLGGLARVLSRSIFLHRGRELWDKNRKDWNLPLSRWEKLQAGIYLILNDFSEGLFPPTFLDQQQAYQNEMNYGHGLPGVKTQDYADSGLRKPFWFGRGAHLYLGSFLKLMALLGETGITPPSKLLELGGGTGWTAEFLCQMGFDVLSTNISPLEVEVANKRLESLRVRGLQVRLRFQVCPMETVVDYVKEQVPFDAVFVYEALHHAFDWRAAVSSAFACLRPGGWLLICGEPNLLHTAVSYRVSKLASTHEIGFRKRELVAHLRQTGFRKLLSRGKRPGLLFRPHWLMAQR
jgi:protein-L-isoaspartate O-methyltransferase